MVFGMFEFYNDSCFNVLTDNLYENVIKLYKMQMQSHMWMTLEWKVFGFGALCPLVSSSSVFSHSWSGVSLLPLVTPPSPCAGRQVSSGLVTPPLVIRGSPLAGPLLVTPPTL